MSSKNSKSDIPVVGSIEGRVNRYYLGVSRKYMAAGIALMLTLILYIIFIMVFFGKYVTYDNLKFLVRDMGNITLPGNDEYSSIVYNGSDDLKAEAFRGGIAICTGDKYLYYDSGGGLLTEDSINYSSPAMAESSKYMLVYDVGGTGYSVYNQLTCIIKRSADARIVTGDIADDGSMILVTRSRETKYVVELYNAAFNKSMSIYKENYVLDAAVSPDGEYIVIASGIPAQTDLDCEISIIRKGSDTPLYTSSYTHTMPLELHAEKEGFIMLCDNGIYFFDYSGGIVSSYSFSGINLRCADINSSGAVIVGSTNALGSENKCAVFDSSGNKVCEKVLDMRITGAYASTNHSDASAYLTAPDRIIKITPDGELSYEEAQSEVITVVPLAKGALICSKTSAYPAFVG